ncbi:unnamed protein product [Orchesella dallaii]|uniref:Tudor domain-containing protein n=1 Tax=Orchesella dallaii TaxID=48710 RepID=A0ABP1QLH5_9HEXA
MTDLPEFSKATRIFYGKKPTFFERPIWSNTPYKYEVVGMVDPSNFHVKIQDEFTDECEVKLKTIKQQLEEDWKLIGNYRKFHFVPAWLLKGTPIVVSRVVGNQPRSMDRGEVLAVDEKTWIVTALLVDTGAIVTAYTQECRPIPLDMLRIPKLAIPCALAFVQPESRRWPLDIDVNYTKQFSGDSQIIYFEDVREPTGIFDVVLEVNNVNIVVKYFHEGFAKIQRVKLPLVDNKNDSGPSTYPLQHFSRWVGFKMIVFGIRAFREDNLTKCILQLNPSLANYILDFIAKYVLETAEEVKNAPFEIVPGVCCLARYEDDYLRARILQIRSNGQVSVEYVDYSETAEVKISDLLKLPQKLLSIPECAQLCVITDFLEEPCNDLDKLSELIKDQNLYATIDAYDPDSLGKNLVVSLFKPIDFTGPEESFAKVFGLTKRVPSRLTELTDFIMATEATAAMYLDRTGADSTRHLVSKAKFAACRYENCIYLLPLSDEKEVRKRALFTSQLSEYYENFRQNVGVIPIGKYVAACTSSGTDKPSNWYRAEVLEEVKDQLKLLDIDTGCLELVNIKKVFPLHAYFLKDQVMAYKVEMI